MKSDGCASSVVDGFTLAYPALGFAAHVLLAIKELIAGHLDFEFIRQRVDDRETNSMQSAGGCVDFV